VQRKKDYEITNNILKINKIFEKWESNLEKAHKNSKISKQSISKKVSS